MMYVEVVENGVRSFLNSDLRNATHYTVAEFLEGAADNEIASVFGQTVLAEIKNAVREQSGTLMEKAALS